MKELLFLLIIISTFVQVEVYAQVDASSRLLLQGRQQSQEIYDESNRYTVKPKSSRPNYERAQEPQRQPRQVIPTQLPEKKQAKQEAKSKPVETPKAESAKVKHHEPKNLTETVRDTFLGGSNEQITQYKSQLHPNDVRHNFFEVDISPTYFYQESTSRYWFRSHHSSGTAVNAGLRIWFTPFFGMQTNYLTSLNSELRATPDGAKFVEVEHDIFEFSLQFRKHFGYSKKAKSINFGLGYSEYNFEVPADSTQRFNTNSKGLKLSLEASLPSSRASQWVWGVEFFPSIKHEEEKTAIEVNSGTDNDASAAGIWFGKRYHFDRRNQVYWKVYHRAEKVLFEGQADTADPVDASQPEGVNITTGTTLLQLGFTWGR